jgi:hypothetical protein
VHFLGVSREEKNRPWLLSSDLIGSPIRERLWALSVSCAEVESLWEFLPCAMSENHLKTSACDLSRLAFDLLSSFTY